jgi:hypothetical protein
MPIIYIHGVAVRNHSSDDKHSSGNPTFDGMLQDITWEMVESKLREYIAPVLSSKPDSVSLTQAYWGDLADLRYPLNQMVARFMGDVFCYLSKRGDASAPGPIPLRILDELLAANAIKGSTGEPLIVLSNSMGCEIMYDVVTYFLPKVPAYQGIKVDYWCGVHPKLDCLKS